MRVCGCACACASHMCVFACVCARLCARSFLRPSSFQPTQLGAVALSAMAALFGSSNHVADDGFSPFGQWVAGCPTAAQRFPNAKGRILSDTIHSNYTKRKGVTIPWFNKNNEPNIRRDLVHNDRCSVGHVHQLSENFKENGIFAEYGQPPVLRPAYRDANDSGSLDADVWYWNAVGGAHRAEAFYKAHAEDPTNTHIQAALDRGFESCTIIFYETPSDIVRWYADAGNHGNTAKNSGLGFTVKQLYRKTEEVATAWAAHRNRLKAKAIVDGSAMPTSRYAGAGGKRKRAEGDTDASLDFFLKEGWPNMYSSEHEYHMARQGMDKLKELGIVDEYMEFLGAKADDAKIDAGVVLTVNHKVLRAVSNPPHTQFVMYLLRMAIPVFNPDDSSPFLFPTRTSASKLKQLFMQTDKATKVAFLDDVLGMIQHELKNVPEEKRIQGAMDSTINRALEFKLEGVITIEKGTTLKTWPAVKRKLCANLRAEHADLRTKSADTVGAEVDDEQLPDANADGDLSTDAETLLEFLSANPSVCKSMVEFIKHNNPTCSDAKLSSQHLAIFRCSAALEEEFATILDEEHLSLPETMKRMCAVVWQNLDPLIPMLTHRAGRIADLEALADLNPGFNELCEIKPDTVRACARLRARYVLHLASRLPLLLPQKPCMQVAKALAAGAAYIQVNFLDEVIPNDATHEDQTSWTSWWTDVIEAASKIATLRATYGNEEAGPSDDLVVRRFRRAQTLKLNMLRVDSLRQAAATEAPTSEMKSKQEIVQALVELRTTELATKLSDRAQALSAAKDSLGTLIACAATPTAPCKDAVDEALASVAEQETTQNEDGEDGKGGKDSIGLQVELNVNMVSMVHARTWACEATAALLRWYSERGGDAACLVTKGRSKGYVITGFVSRPLLTSETRPLLTYPEVH